MLDGFAQSLANAENKYNKYIIDVTLYDKKMEQFAENSKSSFPIEPINKPRGLISKWFSRKGEDFEIG